jgi:phosphatidylglycerol lysyltransferase
MKMKTKAAPGRLPITAKPPLPVRLVTILVFLNGLVILLDSLWRYHHLRGTGHPNAVLVSIPVLLGMSLIYLSTLLQRRKRAAWLVVLPFYLLIITLHIGQIFLVVHERPMHQLYLTQYSLIFQDLLVPLAAVLALLYYRDFFRARSSTTSLFVVFQRTIVILAVTIAYGTLGYLVFDTRDFRQEITVPQAFQYTVDEMRLTTNGPTAYTRRSRAFIDSLQVVSGVVVLYIAFSFFRPLRARFEDQTENREYARHLLADYSNDSEDFFKLWPADKTYFFDRTRTAGLAYHVAQGVAMVMGAPFGDKSRHSQLIHQFDDHCQVNDWLPAFLHLTDDERAVLAKLGFAGQKIGEEAIIDLQAFNEQTVRNKYFRNIQNRFTKQGFTVEILSPPHNDAIVKRLTQITEDWRKQPGRAERSFMMGYFAADYLQQCDLAVVRDGAETIQAFMNLLPIYHGLTEANYDMLRHTDDSPSNINDYLLINVFNKLPEHGFTHFNLGLCPLAGLEDETERNRGIIDRAMSVFYNTGDRFYSFTGLYKFKAKYEPQWRDRYAAYPPGLSNFARAFTALSKLSQPPKNLK